MKNRICLVSLLLILLPSALFCQRGSESQVSAPATATGTVYTGNCWFQGFVLKTDGTNNVTVNIYDGVGVTTTRLIPTDLVVPGSDRYFGYKPPFPIKCRVGIHVTIAVAGGGSTSYQVFYNIAN